MAKKQKQPTKTCSDCIHESACRGWTDGRAISDAAASQCPNHETVKESGAYLCGVLDERNRHQTNADRIRAATNDELVRALDTMCYGMKSCAGCVLYGKCPVNKPEFIDTESAWADWLQQPAEG